MQQPPKYKARLYPIDFNPPVVGANAADVLLPAAALKIANGDFQLEQLSFAAFDGNGQLVQAPNLTIQLMRGSEDITNGFIPIAALARGDFPIFTLREPRKIEDNGDIKVSVVARNGNTATRLTVVFHGLESVK